MCSGGRVVGSMDTKLVQAMTTIVEAVQFMYDEGIRSIDIYYAELISDGETEWAVDVMCDPINDICRSSWTWTVESIEEFIKILEEDGYFISDVWEIVTRYPFSENVVHDAISEWLLVNGFVMQVRVIDVDDATGSGYVRELRELDLEEEIANAAPLKGLDG